MVGPRDPQATSWYDNSIIDQLAAMGLSPADIQYAAFSHMHYDHVGAANAFKDSTILIQINSLHSLLLLHLIQKGSIPIEIHPFGSRPLAGMLSVKY